MARANLELCERLSVFGTHGQRFYPEDEDDPNPAVKDWFLEDGLVGYLDTRSHELMAYLGDVRHPHKVDQAYATYEGLARDSLLSNFDRALNRCLREDAEWELMTSTDPMDNKSFRDLLIDESVRAPMQVRLSAHTDHDEDLIETVLTSDSTEPLVVLVGDFRVAAEIVHEYADLDPFRVEVYEETDIRPPDGVDLALSVQPGPHDVNVPEETVGTLDERQAELEAMAAERRQERTVDAIANHADAADDVELVFEAVEEGLETEYGSYVVQSESEVTRREQTVADLQRRNEELEEEVEHLRGELEFTEEQIRRLERDAKISSVMGRIRGVFGAIVGLLYTEQDRDGYGSERARSEPSNGQEGSAVPRTMGGSEERLSIPRLVVALALLAGVGVAFTYLLFRPVFWDAVSYVRGLVDLVPYLILRTEAPYPTDLAVGEPLGSGEWLERLPQSTIEMGTLRFLWR